VRCCLQREPQVLILKLRRAAKRGRAFVTEGDGGEMLFTIGSFVPTRNVADSPSMARSVTCSRVVAKEEFIASFPLIGFAVIRSDPTFAEKNNEPARAIPVGCSEQMGDLGGINGPVW